MDIIRAIAVLAVIIGLIGTVAPVLPGVTLIFFVILFYALFTGFAEITAGYLFFALALTVFSQFIEYGASVLGTKRFGGSRVGIIGATVGGIIALITMGPLGIIIGPAAGAVVGELLVTKNLQKSLRAGLGTVTGLLVGTSIKVILALILVVTFLQRIF